MSEKTKMKEPLHEETGIVSELSDEELRQMSEYEGINTFIETMEQKFKKIDIERAEFKKRIQSMQSL